MKRDVDDNLTSWLGHKLRVFKMKNVPRYRLINPVWMLHDKQRHIFNIYFYHNLKKNQTNKSNKQKTQTMQCVFVCRNVSIPFIQTIAFALGHHIKQRNLKQTLPSLFLHYTDVRHANLNIQSGSVTQKDHMYVTSNKILTLNAIWALKLMTD